MNQDGKNKGNSLIIINVYHKQDSRVARSQKTDLQRLSVDWCVIYLFCFVLFFFNEKT